VPDHSTEPDLIGFQLGLLDSRESAEVARRLEQSPELRARHDAIGADLRPLSALRCGDPPADLRERLESRVAAAPRLTLHPAARGGQLLQGEAAPSGGGPVISLREFFGLAAAIALFVGVFVPSYQQNRREAQRLACLTNCRNVGAANAAYAQQNAGAFPFAGPMQGPWLVTAADAGRGTKPPMVSGMSRNLFLVLQQGLARPADFVCPGRPTDRPIPAALVQQARDFNDLRHVSYSSPLRETPLIFTTCDPNDPMMSDHNPQFVDRRYQPRRVLNSDSHGVQAGQNVLRADGAALWTSRTDVGPEGDDIMRLSNVSQYTGWERPQFKTDAFLVP
jgi:hypothetical protein